MFPTPDLSHLSSQELEHIYDPAEDTFLLLDALEHDLQQLKDRHPLVCLEIGSGSGCVSTFLAQSLGPSRLHLCSDINITACEASYKTGKQNKVALDVLNADLASPLVQRLKHRVDILLFNPPYVPTSQDEATYAQDSKGLVGSWAGGQNGMEVTNRLLKIVPDLLSPTGLFYLVALKQNNISGICDQMAARSLTSEIVLQRRAGREHLFILRFGRASPVSTV